MHYKKKTHALVPAMKFRKPNVMELCCSLHIDQVTEIQSSNAFNKRHSERNNVLINISSEGYSKYIINCHALIQFNYIFSVLPCSSTTDRFSSYSPINVNDVYLGHKLGLLIIYIQIFNRTIAENYINIGTCNK